MCVLPVLAGCSAVRLGYNQGPELLYWWADGFLDFERGQSPQVRAALHEWMAWHRRTQLPLYVTFLARVRDEMLTDVTPERVCAAGDEVRVLIQGALVQGVAPAAALLPLLQPAQVVHLERKLAERERAWRREHLPASTAEREEIRFQKALEQVQGLYGRLDPAQRQLLAASLTSSGFDAVRWRAEVQARNERLVRELRAVAQAQPVAPARAEALLRELIAEAQQSPRADYRAYAARWREGQCTLWARVHNSTTAAQRRHAAEKLKGWEDDLRALAAQAPPVTSTASPG